LYLLPPLLTSSQEREGGFALLKSIERLGFTFAERIPLFKVRVNGNVQNFLLDSGSPYMVLNGKAGTGAETVSAFEWGGLRLSNQLAMVADISHLGERLGLEIHGLIGCAQIMNYDLLLDYSEKYVSLYDSYGGTPDCMSGAKSIPFIMSNHIPVVSVRIGGKCFSMGLDTGASQNVLEKKHTDFLQGAGLLYDTVRDDVVRFNAGDTERGACSCSIREVGIGDDLIINDMRFYLHDIGIPHIKADGLLGYELFNKQRAFIRFAKRELLLEGLPCSKSC
jgi:hypothetical protein